MHSKQPQIQRAGPFKRGSRQPDLSQLGHWWCRTCLRHACCRVPLASGLPAVSCLCAQLRQDVEQGLAQSMCQGTDLAANQALAAYLTRQGYFVHIRTALGGGEGCDCLRNLRNVFLTVCPPGAAQTTNRFLVSAASLRSEQVQTRLFSLPGHRSSRAWLTQTFLAPPCRLI